MKELELKYGCNPNQKPSRIYRKDGEMENRVTLTFWMLLTDGS